MCATLGVVLAIMERTVKKVWDRFSVRGEWPFSMPLETEGYGALNGGSWPTALITNVPAKLTFRMN